nr:hypothetical protein [Actinomycetota bacterium]
MADPAIAFARTTGAAVPARTGPTAEITVLARASMVAASAMATSSAMVAASAMATSSAMVAASAEVTRQLALEARRGGPRPSVDDGHRAKSHPEHRSPR